MWLKKSRYQKIIFIKNVVVFFNEKKNRKIQVVLDIESSLGKQILDIFWRPVSAVDGFKKFDYSWFLA